MNQFDIKSDDSNLTLPTKLSATGFSRSLKQRLQTYFVCFRARKFQAYCIGMPKSGTHSIDGLFGNNYRSLHEPEFENTWNTLLSYDKGEMNENQLHDILRARDRRLWLELDSSNLNYYLMDFLLHEFPESKFILTIRDCQSWLASAVNHRITRKQSVKRTIEKDQFRFGSNVFQYDAEEKILESYGLPSINVLLTYWAIHNQTAIRTIPQERLLVLRTDEISGSAERIAEFLDIPSRTLNQERSHLFRKPKRENVLAQIDPEYLYTKINQHCSELMGQYFPEISLKPNFHQLP